MIIRLTYPSANNDDHCNVKIFCKSCQWYITRDVKNEDNQWDGSGRCRLNWLGFRLNKTNHIWSTCSCQVNTYQSKRVSKPKTRQCYFLCLSSNFRKLLST